MIRFFSFPKWLRWYYPGAIWDFSFKENEKKIYLTFDDGPTPEITTFILETLDQFQAKATFFCIGERVKKYPHLFEEIRAKGHTIGSHGMFHLNGFHLGTEEFERNVHEAAELIPSDLFRPPYGKIKRSAFKLLKEKGIRVVFWSVMSYDFDASLSSEKRIAQILQKTKSGSIVVFHDSEKAFDQLKKDLPVLMQHWKNSGYELVRI